MGVYVKGMEMPKNCHSCPMCLMMFCQAGDRELSEQETRPNAKRPEDCHLVPVPEPHGRLIDAELLKTYIKDWGFIGESCAVESVDDAPTVIEAEEDE